MHQNQLDQKDETGQEKDNPSLSKVIERNIRTIIHLRAKAARERGLQGRIADAITSFLYWLKPTVFKPLNLAKGKLW